MVQITGNFKFDWEDGQQRTYTYTYQDGPQTFDPSLEARLVKEGTARYVEPETAEPVEEPVSEPTPDLSQMTLKELRAYAENIGVKNVTTYRKAELLAAIQSEDVE